MPKPLKLSNKHLSGFNTITGAQLAPKLAEWNGGAS